MSSEISEIEKHWKQEKEAGPLLYVIEEKEIDCLFSYISSLEEKVKDCERSYRDQLETNVRLIEDLKQAESRLKRLQEGVDEHKSAPPNVRLTMEHDVKLYKVQDEE